MTDLFKKLTLLTLILRSLCHNAFQTCKRVKIMAKIWFSILICSTFKAFLKTLKIWLIWRNNNEIKNFTLIFVVPSAISDNFSGVLEMIIMKLDYILKNNTEKKIQTMNRQLLGKKIFLQMLVIILKIDVTLNSLLAIQLFNYCLNQLFPWNFLFS